MSSPSPSSDHTALIGLAQKEGVRLALCEPKRAHDACRKVLKRKVYRGFDGDARKQVANAILQVPMYQATLLHCVEPDAELQTTYPPIYSEATADALLEAFLLNKHKDADIALPRNAKYLQLRYSTPAWLARFVEKNIASNAEQYLALLNEPAEVSLRVDSRANCDDIVSSLKSEGIDCSVHPVVAHCVKVKRTKVKANLKGSEVWQDGQIEVQDIGSQIIGSAIHEAPRGVKRDAAGELKEKPIILDFCCGLGGKTLQFAAEFYKTHNIIAADISEEAMRELPGRLAKTNLADYVQTKIHPIAEDIKAERVFVDAPCSGLGRLRRRTDNRWWFEQDWLTTYPVVQAEIIRNAAVHVKEKGLLIYATCTMNRLENENVVDDFLSSDEGRDFKPEPLRSVWSAQLCDHLNIVGDTHCVTLWPHLCDSDGFFVARLRRD